MRSLSINIATTLAEPQCRVKPRLSHPFPIKVRGVDSDGEEFVHASVLDNISAGGMYFRMRHRVDIGAHLSIIICMSPSGGDGDSGIQIAAYSNVLRVEELPSGGYGVAAAFIHHRIL